MQKQEEFENGQRIVKEYDEYIELISSVHKDASEQIDWNEVLEEQEPTKPILSNKHQSLAEIKLASYKPSFFDKLFGSVSKKIKQLENNLEKSKLNDQIDFEKEQKKYETALSEWIKYQDMAKGAISKNPKIYKEILEYLDPFSDIKEIGTGLTVSFFENHLVVTLNANGISVIPNFILTQTKTGKLSKKNMPISKFNELYQDYVCGCVLRIAREVFSFLPIEFVFINVKSELLNQATGYLERQTILSVAIPKQTFDRLNFEMLDPSDSMINFKHNMKFTKTKGFDVVTNLQIEEIIKI
ncbi:Conserved hypothetical protein [Capnocytophaga canimorsus Cc5]|uniref:Uncharacterized protein n=2 Tax=Capnocytophaga canimorsus TaxID=28188 RepID=F9YRR6_CAPCC|nr:Conserved hypothetical protein [Capnocytophaga canimorsus Cc5]